MTKERKSQLGHSLVLFIAAVVWGFTFIAQSTAMEYTGPFTFNATRQFVGALSLIPVIMLSDKKGFYPPDPDKKVILKGGFFCGLVALLATNCQQIGIQYTTIGNAGFITAFYMIVVPVIGFFIGKRTGINVWIAVVMSIVGLYFISLAEGLSQLNRGDVIVFLGALCYGGHILVLDHFTKKCNVLKLCFVQFMVIAILSMGVALIMEHPTLTQIAMGWKEILFSGLLAVGVGYTLQSVGQRGLNPAIASIIMSLESAVSLFAGWMFLAEQPTGKELFGCLLMFIACMLAQINFKPIKRKGTA